VNQLDFLAAPRMDMRSAINLSLESLRTYLARHKHLVVMFSGGKDSTAALTFTLWAIFSGRVPKPETITVVLADTRLELPPLMCSALKLMEEAREAGEEAGVQVETRVALAPIDERILVYMLGRGVPPATSMTMRWCTRLAKGKPADTALAELRGGRGDVLILTGLREGESAVRDRRIVTACSSKGGECGAGLYQRTAEKRNDAVLAPLIHWRACHIWEWNLRWAPLEEYGGWSTRIVAEVYGGATFDDKEDLEVVDERARTGCMSCFVIENDLATERVVRLPEWSHLAPVLELKALWRRLRRHDVRLRKPAGERRADGKLAAKQHRVGPLTIAARLEALAVVVDVQRRVNEDAARLGRPGLDILNAEEEARIRELCAANAWPRRWTGNEPLATDPFEEDGQRNFLIEDEGEEPEPDQLVTLGVRRG
jgi:DNA sulfur modification protein DndC